MAKIYYGNGDCTLESSDAKYCEIRVRYPIEITDKSPKDFIIKAGNNKIIIAHFYEGDSTLGDLFSYIGELVIIRAAIINSNGDIIQCIIKKILDYSELLSSNAEDLTIKSEDLKSGHIYGKRVTKMKVYPETIDNLIAVPNQFYLEDSSEYIGNYHIHKETGQTMSGSSHNKDSVNLYSKDYYSGSQYDKLFLSNYAEMKKTKAHRAWDKKVRRRKV